MVRLDRQRSDVGVHPATSRTGSPTEPTELNDVGKKQALSGWDPVGCGIYVPHDRKLQVRVVGMNFRIFRLVVLVAATIITSPAQRAAEKSPGIEDSLGGIRVGETLRSIRRSYPDLHLSPNSTWTVVVGRNCSLEVTPSEKGGEDDVAEVVALERLDMSDTARDPKCNGIRTGEGLRFGDDISTARHIYKQLSSIGSQLEGGQEYEVYTADNGPDCLSGRTAFLRRMQVAWSKPDHRIAKIIEATRQGCREYRRTAKEQP